MPNDKKTRKGIEVKRPSYAMDTKEGEKIEHGLRGIYQNEKGQKVDMTKLDKKGQKKKGFYIWASIGILVILAIAAISGYFLFGEQLSKKDGSKAEIEIVLPEKVASGEIIEVEIVYKNNEAVDIANSTLSVQYPEGFYFQESDLTPKEGTDNAWTINDIPAGGQDSVKIKGQIVGETGATKPFSAIYIYSPENFDSEFQASANASTVITSSVIDIEIDVPQQVRNGETFAYKAEFTNTSEYVLPNARVMIEYPDAFDLRSTDPEVFSNNNNWRFDDLAPGQTQTIEITGVLDSEAGKSEEFKFQFGLVEPNGEFNPQVEKINLVLVINPEISLELEAPEVASAGEDIEYVVNVKNTSEVDIEDLEIGLEFSGGATKQSSATLDKIDKLKAGDSAVLDYETTIKTDLPEGTTEITATASVISAKVANKVADLDIKAEAKTTLSGGVDFEALGRYYTPDLTKIGDGPLPPLVGKKTTYVIIWKFQALGSELEDLKISATLPGHVRFEGGESAGVAYTTSNNRVTYDTGSLSPDDGLQKIEFKVSITPAQTDLNKLLILQEKAIFEAKDINSGQTISIESLKITTDLTEDDEARGKGVVEE
ncbi:hypothetical protein KKC88_00730 [Patescibacteria group bacterium]|nr:hypothetical protein [Patescibacteria group bacterium]MBU1673762.1 hypothetical protein [Patescibacteria group bacterium]MBU1964102.1 hypothetical protein [Patescibacteria group bacterium]